VLEKELFSTRDVETEKLNVSDELSKDNVYEKVRMQFCGISHAVLVNRVMNPREMFFKRIKLRKVQQQSVKFYLTRNKLVMQASAI
jgi:hypothetical protein